MPKKDKEVNFALETEQESKAEEARGKEAVGWGERVTIIMDESDDEGVDEAVLAVKRGADGQPIQNNPRKGERVMKVERLLNPKPQPQRKVVGNRRPKKKRATKKAPKKTTLSIADHAPRFEFFRIWKRPLVV